MIQFSPADAFEFAVRIEENGEKFYRTMAEKFSENDMIKELFCHLADEEVKHKGIYSQFLGKVAVPLETANYPEEYFAYMQAYVERVIFTPERLEAEIKRIDDIEDALDFAIRTELENILYFEELKKFLKRNQQGQVDKIISEERKHFLELSVMKKKYKL